MHGKDFPNETDECRREMMEKYKYPAREKVTEMHRKDVYYRSADKRTRIHAREWLPEGCLSNGMVVQSLEKVIPGIGRVRDG